MEVIFKSKGISINLSKMDLLQLIELGDVLCCIKTHESLELLTFVTDFIDKHFEELYNELDDEKKQVLLHLLKVGAKS